MSSVSDAMSGLTLQALFMTPRQTASHLTAGDAPVHGVAYSDVPAGLQAQVVYEGIHCRLFAGALLLNGPLQLCCVHQHLLHSQHIHQRVCSGSALLRLRRLVRFPGASQTCTRRSVK